MQFYGPLDILIRIVAIVSKRKTMKLFIITFTIHKLTYFSSVIWKFQYNKNINIIINWIA